MYFLTIDCSEGRLVTDLCISKLTDAFNVFLAFRDLYPDSSCIVTETLDDGCDHVFYVWGEDTIDAIS